MPTDGADFGRMKACYGKAYSSARSGADDSEVAEIVALGIERDIRRDGGLPVFLSAVDLVVIISQSTDPNRHHELLNNVDRLGRDFADSTLTRFIVDAVAKVGLASIYEGKSICREKAAEMLLVHIGKSRCDGMTPYITRNRTLCAKSRAAIVASIVDKLPSSKALQNLVPRMLKASPSGLPSRAPKAQPIEYSGMRRFVQPFQKSFSCDRYPNYPHKASQCGCCASCLVRRLSFYAAGLPDSSVNYFIDIFRQHRPLRESELVALTKLTIQADTLAGALRFREPWPALCKTWPELLRTELELMSPSFAEATISLLRRHVSEWQSFSNALPPLLPLTLPYLSNVAPPWNPNSSTVLTAASLVSA